MCHSDLPVFPLHSWTRDVAESADNVVIITPWTSSQQLLFLLFTPSSSLLFPLFLSLFILVGLLGFGGRRFVEEEIALFEDFVNVGGRLGTTARRYRGVVAARLGRTEAPQSWVAITQLRWLLVSSAATATVEFLGFNTLSLASDLLGRWRVEFPGRLGAVVRGSLRLGRLGERTFDGGSSPKEVNGAQRVSHLEASVSV